MSAGTRHPKPKLGVLDSGTLYSTKALQEIGITRMTLSEFRVETGIKPAEIGHANWYLGGELIAWFLKKRDSRTKEQP